ncbi:hypothetical protein FHX82_005192 [Amycolatopsis bartoniae]|nr:hypothetical protein [Amycolatopsis bartoniae]
MTWLRRRWNAQPAMRELGQRVRRHRDLLGLTRRQLAHRCGLLTPQVWLLEHGLASPPIQTWQTWPPLWNWTPATSPEACACDESPGDDHQHPRPERNNGVNEDVHNWHQRLRQRFDEQLDKTLNPMTSIKDLGKIAERELLDFGLHLLDMGLAALDETDFSYRPELEAAVATTRTLATDQLDKPLIPELRSLVAIQRRQLKEVRIAVDDAGSRRLSVAIACSRLSPLRKGREWRGSKKARASDRPRVQQSKMVRQRLISSGLRLVLTSRSNCELAGRSRSPWHAYLGTLALVDAVRQSRRRPLIERQFRRLTLCQFERVFDAPHPSRRI